MTWTETLRRPLVAVAATGFAYLPFYVFIRYFGLFNPVDSVMARGSIFRFVAKRAALGHADQDNIVLAVAASPAFPLLFLTAIYWPTRARYQREYSLIDVIITVALCAWLLWVATGMVVPGLSSSEQFTPLPLLFLNELMVLALAGCVVGGMRLRVGSAET